MSAELERRFAAALREPGLPVPEGVRALPGQSPAWRFAVYRNNVHVGLTDALAARFPVCRALVGDDFFRAMARIHAGLHPPRSPLMMLYGDGFADFIDKFPPAAPVPYLGDMARLEAARTRAYHAADAVPLPAAAFAGLAPDALPYVRLGFHPSLELVASRFPVVSIWRHHQDGAAALDLREAGPEDAMVVRPFLEVELHGLSPGGHRFMAGLMAGLTLGKAAADALAAEPRFDLVRNFAGLIASRAVVTIDMPA